MPSYAGCSFGGGIYRLYGSEEIETWTAAVEKSFPEFRGRVRCFGRDWLCNQFCLDRQRMEKGEALVLLFELGTGQVLKIPNTFETFHSDLLIEDAGAALAENFFGRWRATDSRPLAANECVGYEIPLFLGGKDELENLQRLDSAVYWGLTAQLLQRTRQLPVGTKVRGVSGKE